MPGRQQSGSIAPAAGRLEVVSARASATRGVVPRLLAAALLALAVAAIAALGGYAWGRGSVDQDALQAKAYAAGRAAGANDARHRAAPRAASTSRATASHVIAAPTAEVRAQLRRAYAAGAASAAVAQRAHGRALGAAAVLGNFPGGWATGRWYMVRLAGGGTLTAGQPRLAQRVGPLSDGEGYTACQGGGSVCPVRR